MAEKKSYWQAMVVEGDRAQAAIRAWFAPLSEDMTAYKAEVLCDVKTDREKKLRAFMKDPQGKKFRFERTAGRNYSISMVPL